MSQLENIKTDLEKSLDESAGKRKLPQSASFLINEEESKEFKVKKRFSKYSIPSIILGLDYFSRQ
jgi:hypothetical protein